MDDHNVEVPLALPMMPGVVLIELGLVYFGIRQFETVPVVAGLGIVFLGSPILHGRFTVSSYNSHFMV
jgi:hypothetical protein